MLLTQPRAIRPDGFMTTEGKEMPEISRRTVFQGLGGAGLVMALSACGGNKGGGGGASDTVTVLMVGNPQMKDIEKMVGKFQEATGIKVNLTILPENELRDKVAQDVSTKAGKYDVVTIGAYEGSVWTANDWLHNLQEMAEKDTAFDVEDLLPAMKGVLSKDGDLYSIPFYGESAFMMYRKDIFDKHGLKMPAEPTWEEIKSFAATIKEKESGITPIVMRGLPGWGENMAVVGSMMQSFGAQWFDKDWNPMLTSDNTRQCFEYYVDLVKNYGQTGAAQAGFTECLNIFTQGKAAMWFDATSAANSVESPSSSTVVGKVGYADAPKDKTRAGWVWAWAWAIPKTTKNVENAWKFASWASSKEYEKLVGTELGWTRVPDGKRASTFEIPEYQEAAAAYKDHMLEAIQRSDPNNCGIAPNPAPGCQYLAVPEFAELGTKVGQELSAALSGQKTVDAVLTTSQGFAEAVSKRHKK